MTVITVVARQAFASPGTQKSLLTEIAGSPPCCAERVESPVHDEHLLTGSLEDTSYSLLGPLEQPKTVSGRD